jgi:hypothetical protein
VVFDLAGECLFAFALPGEPLRFSESGAAGPSSFLGIERWANVLTAGAANGLYTAGGILLTIRTPGTPA